MSKVKPEPALMGVRARKGELQTAVNTFKHPDGRAVTIVGIQHIGEEDYYAQLRKIVDETAGDGAQVRLERLSGLDDKTAARNGTEAAALDALSQQLRTRFTVYGALGLTWVEQEASAMKCDPAWTVSDVDAIEFVRLMGPEYVTQAPQLTVPLHQLDHIDALKKKKAFRRLRLLRAAAVANLLRQGDLVQKGKLYKGWREKQVLCAWRECVEALKILNEEGDVTAIWNGGHMRGLCEPLLGNGFTLVDSRWVTALRQPDPQTPIPLD